MKLNENQNKTTSKDGKHNENLVILSENLVILIPALDNCWTYFHTDTNNVL